MVVVLADDVAHPAQLAGIGQLLQHHLFGTLDVELQQVDLSINEVRQPLGLHRDGLRRAGVGKQAHVQRAGVIGPDEKLQCAYLGTQGQAVNHH